MAVAEDGAEVEAEDGAEDEAEGGVEGGVEGPDEELVTGWAGAHLLVREAWLSSRSSD